MTLTVIKNRWVALPSHLSNLMREILATSCLDHPNLLVSRDMGADRGFVFVVADGRQGLSLSTPEGREGLDRAARVATVLHAARGLQHAHEQGIYHRDLALTKILVAHDGQVRLDHVGLALTPETPPTPGLGAIPVPGIKAVPDASATSAAAQDIAALGRTLQGLIGGNLGDRGLPPSLALVARGMLGESSEITLRDMGAVVRSLEKELGIEGPYTPRADDASLVETEANAFHSSPLALIRPKIALGALGLLALLILLPIVTGQWLLLFPPLGVALTALATLTLARSLKSADPVADRVREFLLGGGWSNLLTTGATLVLGLVVALVTGRLGFVLFLGAFGLALGLAYHFAVDRPLRLARAQSLARVTALLKELRLRGEFEESLRAFVCRHAGRQWEEFHEALFGYSAMRAARKRWGTDVGGRNRPRFAAWRDPIIDALDSRIAARNRGRTRQFLESIEERSLESKGVNLLTARRRSKRVAEALVLYAETYRNDPNKESSPPLLDTLHRVATRPDDYLTTHAESDEQKAPPLWLDSLDTLSRILFGPRVRFLLGALLLAMSLVWMHQNALIKVADIQKAGQTLTQDQQKALEDAKALSQQTVDSVRDVAEGKRATQRLEVEGVSPEVTRRLDGFGLGEAGLILLISAFFRGRKLSAFVLPAAAIAVIGPHLVEPGARTLGTTSLGAMALALGVATLGFFFGRSKE